MERAREGCKQDVLAGERRAPGNASARASRARSYTACVREPFERAVRFPSAATGRYTTHVRKASCSAGL